MRPAGETPPAAWPMARPAGTLSALPLERLYLWVAIPVGLLFVFLNPPFGGVPDELQHYLKALALAQGELGTQAQAPRDYVHLREDLAPPMVKGKWPKVEGARVLATLTTRPDPEQATLTCIIGYAYPFGFLPQALALKLALLCRAPPLLAFYAARLLTFLLALGLIHAAIRSAPFGKLVFALVALLPEVFQQIASLSYDALHIGALFYFTAYLLALSQQETPLSRGQRGLVVALSLAGTVLKPGYTLMSLLVFLLPRRLFRARGAYWSFTLGTLLLGFLAFALGRLWFVQAAELEQVDARAQLRALLAHPLAFPGVVVETLYLRSKTLWEGLVFQSGASIEGHWPLGYLFAGVGGLLLLRSHEEVVRLTNAQRLVLLGTALAQGLLIFLTLYLVNTVVGRSTVVGLQGRYFLVLLPPLILAGYKSGFGFRNAWVRDHTELALLAFALILIACAFGTLGALYYGM